MDIREQLFNKFQNGQKPNGDDFRTLIENSFNDNVEVYTQEGMQTQKVKIFATKAVVQGGIGSWNLNYSTIGFSRILSIQCTPIHSSNNNVPSNSAISSTVKFYDKNSANGMAWVSEIVYQGDTPTNNYAPNGTEIQVIVLGY